MLVASLSTVDFACNFLASYSHASFTSIRSSYRKKKKQRINLTTLQINKAHFLKLPRISMTLRHFIQNSLNSQFQLLKHYFYAVSRISLKCKLNMHVKCLKHQYLSKARSFPHWSALVYSIKAGRINCSDFISLFGSYPHNPALEEKNKKAQRQPKLKIVTNSLYSSRHLDYFTCLKQDAVHKLKVDASSTSAALFSRLLHCLMWGPMDNLVKQ